MAQQKTSLLGNEFKTGPHGNSLAEYDGFYVSYAGDAPYGLTMFGPDNGSEGETALYINHKFYILNGDWRMSYSELAPQGADACFAFFKSKYPQFGSTWSAPPTDEEES
jgi:hypothetical protein